MTRTLVTGVGGFTGRFLAPVLAARGHEVHGLVHVPEDGKIAGVEKHHVGDLANLEGMKAILAEVRPDHIVHLAAISFVAHGDVEQIYRTNVVGTRQLLEAIAITSPRTASILIASSANVYGNAREGTLDEDVPPAPANDYGVSKTAMEFVVRLYAPRLPIIVTRPFNYTGKGQSTDFLLPKIVAHARDKEPVIELGNLDVARDFSDVRTVVDAYARLLKTQDAVGGTYNVCSGRSISLSSVLEMVSSISGHSFEVQVNPELVRATEVRTLCGSAARLEGVIGPLNGIPLEETLEWMLQS